MQSKNKQFGNTCIGLKINHLLTIGVLILYTTRPAEVVYTSRLQTLASGKPEMFSLI